MPALAAVPIATWIGAATAVIGAGVSYMGQQKAARAQDEYNSKQEALQAQQRNAALQQQSREGDIWKEKSANIVDEASKVSAAEPREQALTDAEIAATASNVKALEEANALGDASVGTSAEGEHSEAYLSARAKAASEQSTRAIGLARLFGKQGAIGDAMQNQQLATMDNMIKGQGFDFKVRQGRRGFDEANTLFDTQKSSIKFNANAGQAEQALGGLFMQAGASGAGKGFGQASGGTAAK